MKVFSAAVLLVLGLSYVRGECVRHGVRCLEYSVLNIHEEYEERAYPATVWVSASAEGRQKKDVTRSLIMLLYAYLGGANSKGSILNMTVPVRTAKVPRGSSNLYTISIALLSEQDEDPPLPTNPNVTVVSEYATTYVARSFGGRARLDNIWDHQANILQNALSTYGDDASVDSSFYYMAVYDSPWHATDRLNEVWMRKED